MRKLLAGVTVVAALAVVAPASAMGAVVPLYNQSFEDPKIILDPETLPKPTGWIWTGPNEDGTTYERIEDPTAPDGKFVLKVTTDGSLGLGGVHSPSTEVAPNQTHTIQMMIKTPVGRTVWPAVSERAADDTQLVFDEGPGLPGTGEWQKISYSRTFGPNGFKTRGYYRMNGSSPATFYLDKVPDKGVTGPIGPTGATGSSGPSGPTGPIGLGEYERKLGTTVGPSTTSSKTATAECPGGTVVVGGGYSVPSAAGGLFGEIQIIQNRGSTSNSQLWTVVAARDSGSFEWSLRASVICAAVNP